MQSTLFIVAALLATSLASGPASTCSQLTDDGQCLGAVSDEIHGTSPPSLLQVSRGRADDRSKVVAPAEPNSKCNAASISPNKTSWEKEFPSEVGFWDGMIKSKLASGWERFDLSTPIRADFRPYLDLPENAVPSTEKKSFNILVVGSGPASDIGYSDYADAKVNLTLTDPLGDLYKELFEKHKASPPHHVIPLPGEEIECIFPPNSFNLAYSANALDHSYDPVEAMRQMVRAVAPCSWAVVELFENEAIMEGGSGFHTWNFRLDGSRVILEKYNSSMTPYDINDEMRKVGAEMSQLLGHQCYLHGGCSGGKKRLRMNIRKLGADGQKCPSSRIEQN